MNLKDQIRSIRRGIVIRALMSNNGNVGITARELGVNRNHIGQHMNLNIKQLRQTCKDLKALMETESLPPVLNRRHLPETRASVSHTFKIEATSCHVIVGLFEDGSPGELFLRIGKVGAREHGFAEAWAVSISLMLQLGVPLTKLVEKFAYMKFEPQGRVLSTELHYAHSVVDYVMRWMELRFIKGVPAASRPEQPVLDSIDAQRCPHGCGSKGTCGICRGTK
jgi:hypothetical protein